ncbi:MAG: hypothetical protein LBE89_06465 [Helicobacteraceae bacterium]|nr:hypothetical protein [Helicobacteraceae bacterium]
MEFLTFIGWMAMALFFFYIIRGYHLQKLEETKKTDDRNSRQTQNPIK